MSILDIRQHELGSTLVKQIWEGLDPGDGKEKTLPTMLLYDERGLKLFEEITYLEEYYLTNTEIEILKDNAAAITDHIEPRSKVIELGSGNLRKTIILLEALENAKKTVDFYALDISRKELERTIRAVPVNHFQHVRIHGLLGTYDDGLLWLQTPEHRASPITIMSMGSSIGNFSPTEALEFLSNIGKVLKANDRMLVGVDCCQSPEEVYPAYNDREGKTHMFIRNGLEHANRVLGQSAFRDHDWEVEGTYDAAKGCHTASFRALQHLRIDSISIEAGERIRIEQSYKWSDATLRQLFQDAGLLPVSIFAPERAHHYVVAILSPACGSEVAGVHGSEDIRVNDGPTMSDKFLPPNGFPPLQRILMLRPYSNMVTVDLPPKVLLEKAIELRHIPLFYLGHIAAFWDLRIHRATQGREQVDIDFANRFERGIDPEVNDQEVVNHRHTDTPRNPEQWPTKSQVTAYVEKQRALVDTQYDRWAQDGPVEIKQAIWESLEHEMMHLETSFYQMIFMKDVLPIPGKTIPNFNALEKEARNSMVDNEWFTIVGRDVIIGAPRPVSTDGPFYWDNEMPARKHSVRSFSAKARGITVGEYAWYLWENGMAGLPKSWTNAPGSVLLNGASYPDTFNDVLRDAYDIGESRSVPASFLKDKYLLTVFGSQPLAAMLSHPFMGSYDEANGYAKYVGGRIPTREEEESIYAQVEETKVENAFMIQKTETFANVHTSGSKFQRSSLLDHCCEKTNNAAGLYRPGENYADLTGCNIGFQHFHTTPITHLGNQLCGRCENGGTWMWTSSVFEEHPGFIPSDTYSEYSTDFFQGQHKVVLGGSWATHSQIAGRKSFVNFFQDGYPYAWIGARVVKDL